MRDLNDAFIHSASFFLVLAGQFNHQVANNEQSATNQNPWRPPDQAKHKAVQRGPNGFEGVDDGRTDGFQMALVQVEDTERHQGTEQAKAQQRDQDPVDPEDPEDPVDPVDPEPACVTHAAEIYEGSAYQYADFGGNQYCETSLEAVDKSTFEFNIECGVDIYVRNLKVRFTQDEQGEWAYSRIKDDDTRVQGGSDRPSGVVESISFR